MKFASLGTLALTLTALFGADAQAFGRKKRANNACCPTVPTCSSYGSHGGGYGHAGWSGGYAVGGCGYGGYVMTQGMPGQVYGYAGDPNAASGFANGQTQGFQGQTQASPSGQTQPTPMPGTTGAVAGQANQNQSQNPNTTNQNSTTGAAAVTGQTNPGSGVVQASGTTTAQGMPYAQGGVQQMGYIVPAMTYGAPVYSGGSSYGNDCGCGYATADVGRAGRRGLFRR